MKKIAVIAALFAIGNAYGISLGAGGFGGVAIPMGLMGNYYFKMSPKFGGKFLVGVTPTLDVEFAVAYHFNHPPKDWRYPVDEPKTTFLPITFGITSKEMFGDAGIFMDGGFGFYMEKIGKYFDPVEVKVSANKPGFYFGWGFVYNFGPAAFNFNPRFNYVFNKGDYGWEVTYKGQTFKGTLRKGYDDTFVDILLGFDYYFMM